MTKIFFLLIFNLFATSLFAIKDSEYCVNSRYSFFDKPRVYQAFNSIDPHAENTPENSPYAFCGGDPINNVDPTGMDYWSTNDVSLITDFFNAIINQENYHDFIQWRHVTDNDFCQSLTYNDETGKFYATITEIINGELNVICSSYVANLKPGLSSIGRPYVGAFAYSAPFDFFWYVQHLINGGNKYPYYPNIWRVNIQGRIIGIQPIIGYAPDFGNKPNRVKMGRGFRNMSGNRTIQKEQFETLVKKYNLNKQERKILHDYIHGQGYGYHEIEEVIIELFRR